MRPSIIWEEAEFDPGIRKCCRVVKAAASWSIEVTKRTKAPHYLKDPILPSDLRRDVQSAGSHDPPGNPAIDHAALEQTLDIIQRASLNVAKRSEDMLDRGRILGFKRKLPQTTCKNLCAIRGEPEVANESILGRLLERQRQPAFGTVGIDEAIAMDPASPRELNAIVNHK